MKKVVLFAGLMLAASVSFAQSWAWGRIGNNGGNVTDVWGVAADTKGNGFFGGCFPSNITFGSFTLTTQTSNTFLVKYDTSGNVLWARQSVVPGTNSAGFASTVATDTAGNSFLTGWFVDTASFGPYLLKTPVSGIFYGTVFVAKYDAAGNVLWARQGTVPSSSSYAFGNCITTDAAGNVYVGGLFADTITFGSVTLTNHFFSSNIFVVKYNPAGNVVWAWMSDANNKANGIGNAIGLTVDASDNVYVTGPFQDSAYFGSTLLHGNPYNSITYLVKLDANANVVWARQSNTPYTMTSTNGGNAVITDSYRNVYLSGYYDDTVSFGATMFTTPYGYNAAYLVKYDSIGNQMWAKSSGTVNNTIWSGFSLAIDDCNQIYFSGGGGSNGGGTASIIFDKDTITSPGSGDNSYILKIDTGGKVTCGSIIPSGGDDYNGVGASPTGRFVYLGGDMLQDMILGKDTLTVGGFGGEQAFFARWLATGGFCPSPVDTVDTIHTPPPIIEPCGKLFVPDAFSPNGDGQNDVFYVRDNCLTAFHLFIYDRWGNKVFETQNVNEGWDGNSHNKPENAGTFMYYLQGTDNSGNTFSKKGSLALVR